MSFSRFILILFQTVSSNFCFCQIHDFSINITGGTAFRNFEFEPVTGSNLFEHQKAELKNMKDVIFGYTIQPFKRLNIFLCMEVGLSNSVYELPIVARGDHTFIVENLRLSNKLIQFSWPGLGYDFAIGKHISISASAKFMRRYYLNQNTMINRNVTPSEISPWVHYGFNAVTYNFHDSVNSNQAKFDLKLNIKSGSTIEYGIILSWLRRSIFRYDYTSTFEYYLNGSEIPSSTWIYSGLEGIEDNPSNSLIRDVLSLGFQLNFQIGKLNRKSS